MEVFSSFEGLENSNRLNKNDSIRHSKFLKDNINLFQFLKEKKIVFELEIQCFCRGERPHNGYRALFVLALYL